MVSANLARRSSRTQPDPKPSPSPNVLIGGGRGRQGQSRGFEAYFGSEFQKQNGRPKYQASTDQTNNLHELFFAGPSCILRVGRVDYNHSST